MTFFRILYRVLFLLVALLLLAWGGVLAWFTSWKSDRIVALAEGSEIASTNLGDIEYARAGSGPPVLVFHGAPGGYDQALVLGSALSADGFEVIAFSRPGYLRTPLQSGLTPEDQADAAAALLAALEIPSAAVLGSSAGAPAAIEFVRRHPERARALVLFSPVIKPVPRERGNPPLPEAVNELLTGDMGAWAFVELSNRDPGRVLGAVFDAVQTGGETAKQNWVNSVAASPSQLEWFRDLAATVAPISIRETGLRNDLLQIQALPPLPFAEIRVPTLVVQGVYDKFVPIADVEAATAQIPGAELFRVMDAGHIVELGPAAGEVFPRVIAFLRSVEGPREEATEETEVPPASASAP